VAAGYELLIIGQLHHAWKEILDMKNKIDMAEATSYHWGKFAPASTL